MPILKFNGGQGAILCETCSKIIGTSKDYPYYFTNNKSDNHCFCSKECKDKYIAKIKKQCRILK